MLMWIALCYPASSPCKEVTLAKLGKKGLLCGLPMPITGND